MRETVKGGAAGCGITAYVTVLMLAVVAVFAVAGAAYEWWYLPFHAQLERNTVEQSKSFTDSSNLAMVNAIQQYNAIEVSITQTKDQAEIGAYRAQQKALKNDICKTRATMKPDTVSADVNTWLASHGGCL